MITSVTRGAGMNGLCQRTLSRKASVGVLMAALILFSPFLAMAKVTILKGTPAHDLILSDASRPISLSLAQWVAALGNIRYLSETIFDSDSPQAVFSKEQIHTLAPQMKQALAGIRAGQALAFHTGKVRGEVFSSHGALYWYFSRIKNSPAFELTLLAKEDAITGSAIETVSEDDIDVFNWSLRPMQGQSLYRGRPDMLAMPVSTLVADATNTLPAVKQSDNLSARTQTRHVANDHRSNAVNRIDTLHRFLDKSLITKKEYGEKFEAIISEYEKQHPSLEAGLEFLQMLDKKGLIEPAMLEKQQKLLLDRL